MTITVESAGSHGSSAPAVMSSESADGLEASTGGCAPPITVTETVGVTATVVSGRTCLACQ